MAAANGTLTPSSLPAAPPSPSAAKRKRSDADVVVSKVSTMSPDLVTLTRSVGRPLKTALDDIVTVLKSYDPEPSILNRPIASTTTRATSGESESKRAKLTPPHGPTTLSTLVRDSSYASLEAFEKDVENVTSEVIESLEPTETSPVQMAVEQSRLQAKVLAFQKMAQALVSREEAQRLYLLLRQAPYKPAVDDGARNGDAATVKVKEEAPTVIKEEEEPESRTVLTLYGSAQGPKQLFSSLQQPVRVSPSKPGAPAGLDTSVKVTLPLQESSLPNIISTTQVFPLPEDGGPTKKMAKTFGELFPPPAHLPQLSPPKLAKAQTAKGNVITFAPADPFPKPPRKSSNTYSTQYLATGDWLGYGGVDMPKDPTSPTAKQKSRQRALSTGEAQLPPSEATVAAVKQAKVDALFRSVYSSFAPSRDDASAIVPEATKNQVWWQKVGEKRFHDTFPIDPLLTAMDDAAEVGGDATVDEAEAFREVVESYEEVKTEPLESLAKSDVDKGIDEMLEEISELIETLASHQRIRNSSLATNSRTAIPNSSLASLAGSPSSPSGEEIDVYLMLKSQLTLMIGQLPPYAVAKLNGDQLDELNISRTLIIDTEDHKGVLEEDQISRRSAVPAAAAAPSLSRMASAGTSTHSHFAPSPSQYARPSSSVHTSSVRPAQTGQSYYSQPPVQRSPSVHYQRPSAGSSQTYQTPAPSYSSTMPRQGYGASQYAQQTPRASYSQATPGQYYSQRPAATASSYTNAAAPQYYQNTPPTQPNRYATQQAQNGYYRPANAPVYNYNAAPSPHARTASPLKANPPVVQPSHHSSRPAYGTPVASGHLRNTYYPQGTPGASQYTPAQPATPSTAAPGAYSAIGANHQHMMLDRQQAQVAAQSQARLAAQGSLQGSFHRHGSGTPQPATPQYSGQPPPNGAPMVA